MHKLRQGWDEYGKHKPRNIEGLNKRGNSPEKLAEAMNSVVSVSDL